MWGRSVLSWLALFLYVSGATRLFVLIRRKVFRRYGVYLLSYHHVVANGNPDALGHHVSAERFEEQIRFLKKWFDIVSLGQALKLMDQAPLLRDYVAITFDDGYADNYRIAFPILRKLEVRATIFLITGLVGTNQLPWYDECKVYLKHLAHRRFPNLQNNSAYDTILRLRKFLIDQAPIDVKTERAVNFLKIVDNDARQKVLDWLRAHFNDPKGDTSPFQIMTWGQARQMAEHGIAFGSHTVNHPILTRLGSEEMHEELRVSKETIEHELKTRCDFFAYPNGSDNDYNPRIIESLRALGYRSACTQSFGSNRPGSDSFLLKRIGVGNIPPYVLAAKLSGVLSLMFYARELWKTWRSTPWPFKRTWDIHRRGAEHAEKSKVS